MALIVIGLAGCGPSPSRPAPSGPAQSSPTPSGPALSSPSNSPTVVDSVPPTSAVSPSAESQGNLPAPDGATPEEEPQAKQPEWISLFDGETLSNWKSTQFGGEGEVSVEDGAIVLAMGDDMTGVTWKGEPPARMNYEIELEAKRVEGSDFFCGLTFPVGKDYCSLICGGWGGAITGLSSLDSNDAAHNETSQKISYDRNRWYRIRVRVTPQRIEAWLDDKQIVDTDTTGRKIGIRGEVDPSKPLGIATWRTKGAIRGIRLRKLP